MVSIITQWKNGRKEGQNTVYTPNNIVWSFPKLTELYITEPNQILIKKTIDVATRNQHEISFYLVLFKLNRFPITSKK